jgi:hypothetical protein
LSPLDTVYKFGVPKGAIFHHQELARDIEEANNHGQGVFTWVNGVSFLMTYALSLRTLKHNPMSTERRRHTLANGRCTPTIDAVLLWIDEANGIDSQRSSLKRAGL